MSNPSYQLIGDDGDLLTIAETVDLTAANCPAIAIDLTTFERDRLATSATRIIKMTRAQAKQRGLWVLGEYQQTVVQAIQWPAKPLLEYLQETKRD